MLKTMFKLMLDLKKISRDSSISGGDFKENKEDVFKTESGI